MASEYSAEEKFIVFCVLSFLAVFAYLFITHPVLMSFIVLFCR